MIDIIKGVITGLRTKTAIIAPQNTGVHFAVHVAQEASFAIGKEACLFTYLHWNQEQGPTLYGFESELERSVFLLIISCSGIGPKIGLATLECLGGSNTLEAIAQENSTLLSKVPGIGKKKAEQIILHLKEKVHNLVQDGITLSPDSGAKQWQQITQVLSSLNYSRQEITTALQHVKNNNLSEAPFDHQLRTALSYLSKIK